MLQFVYAAIAVAMGAAIAVYLPMLSQSGRIVGSPVLANIPFFLLGALTSTVIFLATEPAAHIGRLAGVPPWMFLAGVVSGFMILGSVFLIPRIGAGPFFILMVAGQILTGMVMSHFGVFGSPVDPVTLRKAAGIALAVGGAYLVTVR